MGELSGAVRAAIVAVAALALPVPSALAHRPPVAVTAAATDVGTTTATLNGTVTPSRSETTYFFEYGPDRYAAATPLSSAGDGREPVAVSAQVGALSSATTYHVRLVAFAGKRISFGDDVVFQTQAAPPPPPPPPKPAASPVAPALVPVSPATPAQSVFVAPPPVLGERVNLTVRAGTVTVKGPADASFTSLESFASLPVGSLVNARGGSVTLTSAVAAGGTQTGIFHGGLFEVRQAATAMTTLVLRGRRPRCRRGAAAVTARRRTPRALWGNVRHGNFRTRGGSSVATVRGTIWYVEDRCDGTLTRVRRGSVLVRDLRLRRTVVVRAGHRYFARARR